MEFEKNKWIWLLVLFVLLIGTFAVVRLIFFPPEPVVREPWDDTVYHTYVESTRGSDGMLRTCPVMKLYTNSVCLVDCPDEGKIDLSIDLEKGQSITAKQVQLDPKYKEMNCTSSCEGVFVGYSCGGVPDE